MLRVQLHICLTNLQRADRLLYDRVCNACELRKSKMSIQGAQLDGVIAMKHAEKHLNNIDTRQQPIPCILYWNKILGQ